MEEGSHAEVLSIFFPCDANKHLQISLYSMFFFIYTPTAATEALLRIFKQISLSK